MNKIPYVPPYGNKDISQAGEVYCSTIANSYATGGKGPDYPHVTWTSPQCCAFMFAQYFDSLNETSLNCLLGQVAKVGRVCYLFVTERQQPAWELFKKCPWATCVQDVPTKMNVNGNPGSYRVRMYTLSVPKSAVEGLE